MNESDDRIIALLEEIRDNQVIQADKATAYTEYVKKIHDAYAAQLSNYEKALDSSEDTRKQYRTELGKRVAPVVMILGIIAACMVIGLILRIIG